MYGSEEVDEEDFQPRPEVCRRRRPRCLERLRKTSSNWVGLVSDMEEEQQRQTLAAAGETFRQ